MPGTPLNANETPSKGCVNMNMETSEDGETVKDFMPGLIKRHFAKAIARFDDEPQGSSSGDAGRESDQAALENDEATPEGDKATPGSDQTTAEDDKVKLSAEDDEAKLTAEDGKETAGEMK